MNTCPATITINGLTLTCEIRGHRKPETIGPKHVVVLPGGVVVTWPTKPLTTPRFL